MARDMVKKNLADERWKKEKSAMYGARVTVASGIPAAMQRMVDETGKTKNAYVVEAIREKLIRDGYLQEK